MLAATSRRDSPIGLFQTVLKSFAVSPDVGASLRAHTLFVLQSACAIATDPAIIDAATPPESIELALCLRSDPDLSQRLEEFKRLDSIPPAVARQLLAAFSSIAA